MAAGWLEAGRVLRSQASACPAYTYAFVPFCRQCQAYTTYTLVKLLILLAPNRPQKCFKVPLSYISGVEENITKFLWPPSPGQGVRNFSTPCPGPKVCAASHMTRGIAMT